MFTGSQCQGTALQDICEHCVVLPHYQGMSIAHAMCILYEGGGDDTLGDIDHYDEFGK
jgi:hypothetical protein